jgi:hypothetical protein
MNVRYGTRLFRDDEGDMVDAADLRDHALDLARALIGTTRLQGIRDWLDCTLEITDAGGAIVSVVPFSDALRPGDAGGG